MYVTSGRIGLVSVTGGAVMDVSSALFRWTIGNALTEKYCMNRKCSNMGPIRILSESLKERDRLGDIGIDEEIMLR